MNYSHSFVASDEYRHSMPSLDNVNITVSLFIPLLIIQCNFSAFF